MQDYHQQAGRKNNHLACTTIAPAVHVRTYGMGAQTVGASILAGSRRWVTSDKTHIEHSESAVTLIADMPVDIDFRRNGPILLISLDADAGCRSRRL
jgi:hypothetical protein